MKAQIPLTALPQQRLSANDHQPANEAADTCLLNKSLFTDIKPSQQTADSKSV
jgi:hypothetical protein